MFLIVSMLAWYRASQSATANSASLSVIPTAQKGWAIYDAATSGNPNAVVTTLKDATNSKINIGMPAATLASETFSSSGTALKQYYFVAANTYRDAGIDTHTSTIDFWVENTNPTDAASPTLTISVVDDTGGQRSSDVKWILFEGTAQKSTSGYTYGALESGTGDRNLETNTVSATTQANVTYSPINGGARGEFHLYVWVEGTNVEENNYDKVIEKVQILVE